MVGMVGPGGTQHIQGVGDVSFADAHKGGPEKTGGTDKVSFSYVNQGEEPGNLRRAWEVLDTPIKDLWNKGIDDAWNKPAKPEDDIKVTVDFDDVTNTATVTETDAKGAVLRSGVFQRSGEGPEDKWKTVSLSHAEGQTDFKVSGEGDNIGSPLRVSASGKDIVMHDGFHMHRGKLWDDNTTGVSIVAPGTDTTNGYISSEKGPVVQLVGTGTNNENAQAGVIVRDKTDVDLSYTGASQAEIDRQAKLPVNEQRRENTLMELGSPSWQKGAQHAADLQKALDNHASKEEIAKIVESAHEDNSNYMMAIAFDVNASHTDQKREAQWDYVSRPFITGVDGAESTGGDDNYIEIAVNKAMGDDRNNYFWSFYD